MRAREAGKVNVCPGGEGRPSRSGISGRPRLASRSALIETPGVGAAAFHSGKRRVLYYDVEVRSRGTKE